MIKKEIEIVVETGNAKKNVKGLSDSIDSVGKNAEESGEKGAKGIKKVGKASEDSGKAAKGASMGVKAIGTAFAAIGIGAIIALVGKFVQVLTSNKTISDALATTFETINIVLTEVVSAIVDAFTSVSEATNGFESFRKVIGGLVTLGLTPMKLAFFSIKLALQEAQLAWEKSLFGSGDQTTIDQLNIKIKETKKDLADVAIEAVQAGTDIANNVGGLINEVVALSVTAGNSLSDISVSAAIEEAKLNTQLKNSAVLAEARIQGLIEKYDRQAELLRQVRDDDKKSIADRIEANEKLGAVLDEQAKKQKEQARIRIAAARSEMKTAEDKVAAEAEVIRAVNELAAIEAQVEGFRSEQLVNRNALDKERIEILRQLNEIGKNDLELAKSEAEQVRDDRLIQIELQVEDETEKFRLLAAARADFDKTIADLDEAEDQRIKEADEKAKADADATAKSKIEIAQKEADAKRASVDGYVGQVQQAAQILGEETAAGKAAAAAGALFSTYESATKSYNALAGIPVVGPALGVAAAGLAVTNGLANVKQILAVKVAGQSGGGSVGGAAGGAQSSPAFNLTGRSNVNQLQTGIDEQETSPVRAFVVSQDVTSQQAADRATRSQASFG
jgi:hypothetical protein